MAASDNSDVLVTTCIGFNGVDYVLILDTYSSYFFFFSSRRRHTRLQGDWSSDVCSSDLEPQCFINNNYKRNEKSDIYSLGVLFWEISSGKPPFSEISIFKIILDIFKGIREIPIINTPFKYQQLYEKCWKEEPNQRPDIDEIYRILIQLNKLILIIQ